jgi:Cysteine-rich secretory protein family
MKIAWLSLMLALTATFAHAEDMAELISQYRREYGLSTVKTDPELTEIAERQAKAMAASGVMDHNVAGSFPSRMAGVQTSRAAENIAAGTKTLSQTFRMWQTSPGHNANLLQAEADSVGVAVAHNDRSDTVHDLLGDGDRRQVAGKRRATGSRRVAEIGDTRFPKIPSAWSRTLSANICADARSGHCWLKTD